MALTAAQKQKIEEEEAYKQKVREEQEYREQLRQNKSNNQPKKKGIGILGWLLIIFVGLPVLLAIIMYNYLDASTKKIIKAPVPSIEQTKRIPYSPVGGTFIVIDPKYVNAADLETLGQELLSDYYSNKKIVWLSIYDNQRAIDIRDSVINDQASQADTAFYDLHYVAQYNRNDNSGYDGFVILQNGSGQAVNKEITY